MAGEGARAGDLVREPASLPGPRAGVEGLPICRTELYPTCRRAIPSPRRCGKKYRLTAGSSSSVRQKRALGNGPRAGSPTDGVGCVAPWRSARWRLAKPRDRGARTQGRSLAGTAYRSHIRIGSPSTRLIVAPLRERSGCLPAARRTVAVTGARVSRFRHCVLMRDRHG